MNGLILISAVCMQIGWICGVPYPQGIGAYAYQDSAGNRYGGTYGLNDEQTVRGDQLPAAHFPVPFGPGFDDFFPEYFRNFENLLQDRHSWRLRPLPPLQPLPPLRSMFSTHTHYGQSLPPFRGPIYTLPPITQSMESFHPSMTFHRVLPTLFPPLLIKKPRAFDSNKEYQRKALETARKAYDITSNQAGFMPNIDFSRFSPFGSQQFQSFGMPSFGQNSAMAAGLAAPGFTHQFAGLSPANPNMPNVDVTNRFSENGPSNGFLSVASSSFSSSVNTDGKPVTHRHAETLVNNNGKVTHYKVQD